MSGWAYGFDSRQPHHVGTEILIQWVSRFLSLLLDQNGNFQQIFVHFESNPHHWSRKILTSGGDFLRFSGFLAYAGAETLHKVLNV